MALARQRDTLGFSTARTATVLSRVGPRRRLLLLHAVRQLRQRQTVVTHYKNRTGTEAAERSRPRVLARSHPEADLFSRCCNTLCTCTKYDCDGDGSN